jgi:hypothetical protein
MVGRCLRRQSHQDFEWLVCSPFKYSYAKHVPEPHKRDGDYYNLSKAMNALYKASKGDLLVQITDWIYFPPDTLERLWSHYQDNPKGLVTAVGDQYDHVENNKPEGIEWVDPRKRTDQAAFREIYPIDMEMCVASIPRNAVVDCGGMDEEWDKYAAIGEKEMCMRMDYLGYKFYLDQTIEYRALSHGKKDEQWEERYTKGSEYFQQCRQEMINGTRKKLDFVLR